MQEGFHNSLEGTISGTISRYRLRGSRTLSATTVAAARRTIQLLQFGGCRNARGRLLILSGTVDMADRDQYAELSEYLRSEGQTDAEIEKILVRVRQYERETQQDSIMDSIGNGTLDLDALIKEALGEPS